jgi:hypothetical protein
MDARTEVLCLLAANGAELIRTGRHNVFRFPSGKRWITPTTASERHAWRNNLAALRVELGQSTRGKAARLGERRKKVRRAEAAAAPAAAITVKGHTFGQKMRAAISGEKLQEEVPALPPQKKKDQPNDSLAVRLITPGKTRLVQHASQRTSPGRTWTRTEIEAANLASRAGKLDEFMQAHDAVRTMGHLSKPTKEHSDMLTLEQIDATIAELRAGIETAQREAVEQEERKEEFKRQSDEAEQRRLAALEKSNNMSATIAALELASESIEKVRPMLGLVNRQPEPTLEAVPGRRIAFATVVTICQQIIGNRGGHPMPSRSLHAELVKVRGMENYSAEALSVVLSKAVRQNGHSSLVRSANGYGLPERSGAVA